MYRIVILQLVFAASNTHTHTLSLTHTHTHTHLSHPHTLTLTHCSSGVHLASLVYSDDSKVLVTVDDNIPIVEVSDSHSSAVGVDFVWLAKVSGSTAIMLQRGWG